MHTYLCKECLLTKLFSVCRYYAIYIICCILQDYDTWSCLLYKLITLTIMPLLFCSATLTSKVTHWPNITLETWNRHNKGIREMKSIALTWGSALMVYSSCFSPVKYHYRTQIFFITTAMCFANEWNTFNLSKSYLFLNFLL